MLKQFGGPVHQVGRYHGLAGFADSPKQEAVQLNRLSNSFGWPISHAVLTLKLSGSIGFPLAQAGRFDRLSSSLGYPTLLAIDSTGCPLPQAVRFHRLSASTGLPIPQAIQFLRLTTRDFLRLSICRRCKHGSLLSPISYLFYNAHLIDPSKKCRDINLIVLP